MAADDDCDLVCNGPACLWDGGACTREMRSRHFRAQIEGLFGGAGAGLDNARMREHLEWVCALNTTATADADATGALPGDGSVDRDTAAAGTDAQAVDKSLIDFGRHCEFITFI